MQEVLDALRGSGWTVGVHNDYRKAGELYTFWLLTHVSGVFVKAEGLAVDEAKVLEELRAKAEKIVQLGAVEAQHPPLDALTKPQALKFAKLDRPLMDACAGHVMRRGQAIDPARWDAKEMLQYFGCLLQHVRDSHAPAKFFDVKERRSMTRLLSWLKAKQTKRLLEFCIFNWRELSERLRIRCSIPNVPVIYGFRQGLVDAMENGLDNVSPERDERTHRSDFAAETAPPKPQRAFG